MKPERFGRYVLLDRIAIGGMAEVFRAVLSGAEGFRRTFVVKRILSQFCQSGDFVEMEYVRGRDLQEILRRLSRIGRAFPIPLAAYIVREVASGLGYAHELAG